MTDESREKTPVQDLLDDVESALQGWLRSSTGFALRGRVRWIPPTDVYETAAEYRVTLAAPGLDPADLSVRFESGVLVLRGVRRETCAEERRYHKMEIPVGAFERAVRFPRPIDSDAISVRYENGLVHVILPKVGAGRRDVPIE